MTRKTLKLWAIGFGGLLFLAGLFVFIFDLLDKRNPEVVHAPDKITSFVEMLDLGDLVASVKPSNVELKFVTQGSGGGTGQFRDDWDPSVHQGILLEGATSRKNIEFEMTCEAERRALLLLRLKDAMTKSLSRWNSDVQIGRSGSHDGAAETEDFVLEYRADSEAGSYEGEIRVAVKEVSKELIRPSETGKVIHSLSIASNEARWARK